MIQVFLADEYPVVLAGLHSFFSGTEFRVVGTARNFAELLSGLEEHRPQILLLDTRQKSFADISPERFIQQRHWACQVVELSGPLKSASREEILHALRRVAPQRISARGTCLPAGTAASLTRREIEVLRLLAQGRSNKEIAKTLAIALDTVKEHVHNILRKTSQADRTQAALWAIRNEIASL